MQPSEFIQQNKTQVKLAGPRYTPGMDPNAPNIEIKSVLLTGSAVALNTIWAEHIKALRDGLKKASEHPPAAVRNTFKRRVYNLANLTTKLDQLITADAANVEVRSATLRKATKRVVRSLSHVLQELEKLHASAHDDKARRDVENAMHSTRVIQNAVEEIVLLVESPAWNAVTKKAVLLLGEWGTGKTHFLCDLTLQRDRRKLPTLFYLAQNLSGGIDPLQAICDQTRLAQNPRALFKRLDALGQQSASRGLLIIDGINEGDRAQWKRSVRAITGLLKGLDNVGVILSCRRPFDDQIFSARSRAAFVTIEHPGFETVEFDAQVEYFAYYRIPAPHVPLLAPEFARPLFLKMLCETVYSLAANGKRAYLRDLSSGQKGMTRVLEDFVKKIGRRIETDFALPAKACWDLLKGYHSQAHGLIIGIAPIMAASVREYVTMPEALSEIQKVTGWNSSRQCSRLLERLFVEGLLLRGVNYETAGTYTEVVRLPYQRFSDHLISRHLMQAYLNTNTPGTIRRSFYSNRPLGKIFALSPGGHSFAMPGLAAALMLEFPERVKRDVPKSERELLTYLPVSRRLVRPVQRAFLDGLEWRSSGSFSNETDYIVEFLLRRAGDDAKNQTLESLVALATRPGHPYSATRLRGYLAKETMPARDLFWSEYIRQASDTATIFRLLAWLDRTQNAPIPRRVARDAITLLALFLTTTRRALRDQVTKALVQLGSRNPAALFAATIQNLGFNDPYVPERLLAASYGVAMRYWADPNGASVRKQLPRLAKQLTEKMFVPPAPNSTWHVLMQDFALGVVELGQRIQPKCIPSRSKRYVKSPLTHIPSPFPEASAITDNEIGDVADALHMDFDNYTLGHLIPERRNYDSNNAEYQTVRRQVLRRMANLGYSGKQFKTIDDLIGRYSWYARGDESEKVDRYGKKYSWISYFEQYGLRLDAGLLSEWRSEERTSDIDIDPSFPTPAREWLPKLSDPFANAPHDHTEWIANGTTPDYSDLLRRDEVDGIKGPWVLVEGFVEQAAPDDARRVFTFVRGLAIRIRQKDLVTRMYGRVEYPGNSQLPEPIDCHYTFGGEIPWAKRFAVSLRTKGGLAKPDRRFAFGRYSNGRWRGIAVEVFGARFSWEGYHSRLNQVSGVVVPTPSFCDRFGLVNHANRWDYFTSSGHQATIYREFKEPGATFGSHLLYVRASLMRRYLQENEQRLVWFPWGERTLAIDALNQHRDRLSADFKHYQEIHRQSAVWSGR
ncbi:MAG: ATP-binding protein [Gemmatimonadaceae bacterium]|nr:ATP-binding protein [Gemmatimonadaceae bacterium]